MRTVTSPQRQSFVPGGAGGLGSHAARDGDGLGSSMIGLGAGDGAGVAVSLASGDGVAVSACWTNSSSPPGEATTTAPTTPVIPTSATPATAQRGLIIVNPWLLALLFYAQGASSVTASGQHTHTHTTCCLCLRLPPPGSGFRIFYEYCVAYRSSFWSLARAGRSHLHEASACPALVPSSPHHARG